MLSNRVRLIVVAAAVGTIATGALVTVAAADDDSDRIRVRLSGYQEDPMPVSTEGWGEFSVWIDERDEEIKYKLRYDDLEGSVTQAHIHFGGVAQSGGVSAWLCDSTTNPAPAPTDPPSCPADGSVSGTIEPADVVGPAAQGIEAGAFDELVDAIRARTTYVNVHSTKYPAGEIRSQLTHRGHR